MMNETCQVILGNLKEKTEKLDVRVSTLELKGQTSETNISWIISSIEEMGKKVEENVKKNAQYSVVIGIFTAVLTAMAEIGRAHV